MDFHFWVIVGYFNDFSIDFSFILTQVWGSGSFSRAPPEFPICAQSFPLLSCIYPSMWVCVEICDFMCICACLCVYMVYMWESVCMCKYKFILFSSFGFPPLGCKSPICVCDEHYLTKSHISTRVGHILELMMLEAEQNIGMCTTEVHLLTL